MNISRLNYTQTLPLIKRTIQTAHFLALDLEMSGIHTENTTSPAITDSIQSRYEKQRQSICKFIPLQFGLTSFKVLPKQEKIVARPFNFHIFPLSLPNDPMKFQFHAGTMKFLTKNNFDFNKLFYDGVPYTRKDKLQLYKKDENILEFRRELRKNKIFASPEVKVFVSAHQDKIKQWIYGDQQEIDVDIKGIKYQAYMGLKQKIEETFTNQSLSFIFDSQFVFRRKKMTITKCPPSKQNTLNQQLDCNKTDQPFFNQVIDFLISSAKPLVVHNGFLDLMHIYYRFIQELPPSWTQYKNTLTGLFPHIYDNKYLFANSPTLNSFTDKRITSLGNCYLAMRKQELKSDGGLKIQLDYDFGEYSFDNLECHEAGFDSLMTGYSFLRGITTLNKDIYKLTNPQQFKSQFNLYHNRLPQGSIKIPFNLSSSDDDIYTKDGNPPIYFHSVLQQSLTQQRIQEYFSINFGSVKVLWTSLDMTDFCLIFLSQENQLKYQQYLVDKQGESSSIIVEIEKVKFLVRSENEQREFVNNYISKQLKQEGKQNN